MTVTPNKRPKNLLNGWLNLHKPLGMTSNQAIGALKRIIRPEKIGHAGTLDPLADGVLPIALGEATKTVAYMMDAVKVYEFTVDFGSATATDDREGEVVARSDHRPSPAEITAILPQFLGVIMQMPPAYSALKIDGQRAYDLARAGEEVLLKARPVRIDALEFVATPQAEPLHSASFRVTCGKGTYVRSLARDIAQGLGTVGHVSRLHRAQVGNFHIKDSISLDFLDEIVHKATSCGEGLLSGVLMPVSAALDDIPAHTTDIAEAQRLRRGQAIDAQGVADGLVALYHERQLVAIGERCGAVILPRRVFNLG